MEKGRKGEGSHSIEYNMIISIWPSDGFFIVLFEAHLCLPIGTRRKGTSLHALCELN